MNKPTLPPIAAWVSSLAAEQVPVAALKLVKRAFLDTLGVTLLGTRLDSARIAAAVATTSGGAASVFGMRCRADPLSAALVNGTAAHAELFDDNSAPMIAHPSAPLVSALLPLAQARNASGRDVVTAYVAGFEVGVGLGRALNPAFYERGWHATRTLGVIGAAAACARLLRLDAARTATAIAIAASMASGIRQAFGTMTMALHAGLTARDGVHAALLAEAGFGADPQALDGRYGFYEVYAGRRDIAPLPLGAPFELVRSGIIFKPYPSGAPTHAAVDAALALRDQIGPAAPPRCITCFVHPWNFMTLREEPPATPLQARVSLRFCVAAALRYGRLTYAEFSEHALADMDLRLLMERIEIRQAADLPDNGEFPAEVMIETANGRLLRARREVPPGGSSRPLDDADIVAKFRACAALLLDPARIERVIAMVAALDEAPGVGPLCNLLEAGPPA